MAQKDIPSQQYSLIHQLVIHEAQAQWNTSNFFLVANTFLATLLGTNILTKNGIPFINVSLIILGLVISILWFLSYIRTSSYYKLRMYQAKKIEGKLNLKEHEKVFTGLAEKFAEGKKEIKLKNKKEYIYFNFLGSHIGISNLTIIKILCLSYIIFYLILLGYQSQCINLLWSLIQQTFLKPHFFLLFNFYIKLFGYRDIFVGTSQLNLFL